MQKLEAYKAFSVVAWLTVILFSFFTYTIVLDLKETITDLDASATQTKGVLAE